MTIKDDKRVHPDIEEARKAQLNPQALDALVERLYPRILQVARYVLNQQQVADDVAQNAALEVYRCIHNYKGLGSLEAWVGQITFRVAMRENKSKNKIRKVETSLSEEQMSDNPSPEQNVARYRLFQSLQKELETIPNKRRVPLLLHVSHGYTVKEVAQITAMTPDTVKYSLKKAYRELREILEKNPSLYGAMLEELK